MKNAHSISLVIVCSFLMGCAVGNKHAYHTADVAIQSEGTIQVAVATHDQRSYVVEGKKEPDFVGLQRGGFGNPFNVTTSSGNALAEDMSNTIVRALQKKGFNATAVMVSANDTAADVKAALKSTLAQRLLLLTLTEWKSDTFANTALIYDLRLEVLDKMGVAIAQESVSGKDNLKGSTWNPPAHAKRAIPVAFKEKLEMLLNTQPIMAALR